METRRLKNIFSHLSAYPSSPFGNSSSVNATNNAEKHLVTLPGNSHWQPEAHTSVSRSRSSSCLTESRRLDLAEEAHMRQETWYANASRESQSRDTSHSAAAEGICGGSLQFKNHIFDQAGDTDGLKTGTSGCSMTDLTCLQHEFSSGAVKFERSMQYKSSHSKDEVSHASSLSPDCNHHLQVIGRESQGRARSPNKMQNKGDDDIQTCRDALNLKTETIEIPKDSSVGSISRNNVMTGQRICLVEDCVFCLIIQGLSPSFKLYEDEMCICILDVHPLSHGHALLIPKAHFPSLEFTPPEVAAAMCATVPLISMAIMQATNCDSFNLLVNSGKAAGQVVFHTHFHIIPRRTGDNLWRSEDANRRALPMGHDTALLVQQIRQNLSTNKCL